VIHSLNWRILTGVNGAEMTKEVNCLLKNVVPVGGSNMKSCQCLLPAVLLLMMSLNTSAAELTVRVFERGGKAPLQGVAVCLGTSARLNQFGASFTNSEGYVVFPGVPRTPLVVTVSRSGYMSGQEHMNGSAENRMLVLSLPTGGGGVECPLGQNDSVQTAAGLEIKSFLLNKGAATTRDASVTLDNKFSGHATQYRASERPDFRGAEWQSYDKRPSFQLSAGRGSKTVYFQLRRYARINGADLEARSSIKRDSITAQY
jgi:hypothetical protein